MHLEEIVQKHKKSFGGCRPAITESSLCNGMIKNQDQCWEKSCIFVSMTNIDNWVHICVLSTHSHRFWEEGRKVPHSHGLRCSLKKGDLQISIIYVYQREGGNYTVFLQGNNTT